MGNLVLMRGLPGSGKSFSANQMRGNICSADDYFIDKNGYSFDPLKLPQAHAQCQFTAEKAMSLNANLVVIDNTNTKLWEMKPYIIMAEKYSYTVSIGLPISTWQADPYECAKRNTHNVPLENIVKMKEGFEVLPMDWLRAIKDAKAPWES
jgi:predicted kinase